MTRAPRFPVGLDRATSGPNAKSGGRRPSEVLRPQAPLQHAAQAQEAQARATPQGLGLDSAAVRGRMVTRLRASGIADERVLEAFQRIERHRFVDSALATQAYEDTALPIGLAQTISKPSVVARMLGLLFEGSSARAAGHLGRVLEIGTGCGYQAALLALLARSVVSIERLQALHDKARAHLAPLRRAGAAGVVARHAADILLVYGDGRLGHSPRAPYTSIVAAAGGEDLPPAWLEQLSVGGRLVAPVLEAAGGAQSLLIVDRDESGLRRSWAEGVHFVPLKSGAA